MKWFVNKIQNNNLAVISAAWILSCLTCSSTFAQGSFATEQQVYRDNSVVPTDFQKEIPPVDPTLMAMEDVRLKDSEESARENTATPFNGLLGTLKDQTSSLDLPKVVGSLAIVLGGYLGFVWLTRRLGVSGNQGLPSEVVEVLGQTAFGPRKQLQLVRLGSKLLLLLNSHDGSTQTIGEITDPHEVDYLSSICGNRNSSRSAIAISKATSSQEKSDLTGSELKRVLRQLQQSGERNRVGTVFDA